MKRLTVLVLTGPTLLSLAFAAFPQASFAQSNPFVGTWQLNLAKSKFSPGPPPRSQTVDVQAVDVQVEGQGLKVTTNGVGAEGNPTGIAFALVFDGIPHPTGNPNFDAGTAARLDAYTLITSRSKAGKLVSIQTVVVSPDGKTLTITTTGPYANGPINNIQVYDKQ
jgi:hypothetical protein